MLHGRLLSRLLVRIPEEDSAAFEEVLMQQNMARVYPLAILALVAESLFLLHSSYDYFFRSHSIRQLYYIVFYSVMVLMMLGVLAARYMHHNKIAHSASWAHLVVPVSTCLTLLWAAGATLLDMENGNSQMTLLICLTFVLMVMTVLRPKTSFTILFFVYGILGLALQAMFPLHPQLTTLIVGSIGAALCAWFVSYVLYSFSYSQFCANKIIQDQNKELVQLNLELEALSGTDPLTGLMNRRLFDQLCHVEWQRALRTGSCIAVCFADVDDFKQYNDLYGHQAGDQCLSQVAAAMQSNLRRAGDILARYGGEEFVIMLTGIPPQQANKSIRRVKDGVESLGIPHATSSAAQVVTISVGVFVGVPSHDSNIREFILQADQALYRSKSKGKNQIVITGLLDARQ